MTALNTIMNEKFSPSELILTGFNGLVLDQKTKAFLQENVLGGLLLFRRNVETIEQVVALNQDILNVTENNCLISVDQEGGRVARLSSFATKIPPMRDVALSHNPKENALKIGSILGSELRALGFNLDFAPVCDVFSDKDNQVIGDRAFSYDENTVATLAVKIIQGLEKNLVAACAKHFPGHGDTKIDSHFLLPVIKTSKKIIFNRELVPFMEAIKSNVATVMTAHILFEDIDDKYPATMSEKVMNILTKDLGYKGVIISDDLEMKAVYDNYKLEETLWRALKAKVNMFIVQNFDYAQEVFSILNKIYNSDKEIAQYINESIIKVRNLKSKYNFDKKLNLDNAKNIISHNKNILIL